MGRIREALFAPWDRRRPAEAVVPHEAIEAADRWMVERLRAGLDAAGVTLPKRKADRDRLIVRAAVLVDVLKLSADLLTVERGPLVDVRDALPAAG